MCAVNPEPHLKVHPKTRKLNTMYTILHDAILIIFADHIESSDYRFN